MKVLVTGIAGFIGFHLSRRLIQNGAEVVGIDSVNDYYDIRVKIGRLREIGLTLPQVKTDQAIRSSTLSTLRFYWMDLSDKAAIHRVFERERVDRVVNLAAQAGVRFSLTNPEEYVRSNIEGFLNILEATRQYPVEHLVYASSSSVYGIDTRMPFVETTAADHPSSMYAVTKRTNELMAHSYSHLYGLATTGLRFFSVYGPWGRPDMALYIFTKAILNGKPIDVFNNGHMKRDFTYIDDIVEGIIRVLNHVPQGKIDWNGLESGLGPAPARVFNIGNGAPVNLMDFISALESELGVEAKKNMLPLQAGDVPSSWADCTALQRETGYHPGTDFRYGIREFVKWYMTFCRNDQAAN